MKVLSWLAVVLMVPLVAFGQSKRMPTVIIDPGHGGHDLGAYRNVPVHEKHVALDVSLRLDQILRRAGYRTVLTRRSDIFVPLGRRAEIANSHPDGIFVSVHFNAASRSGAAGIETFWNNSPQCFQLASSIQRNLISAVRTENRGVKRRGFYVLRNTRIPSVLVECGFLTNAHEGRLATNPRHRQLLAEQIYRGVVEYSSGARYSSIPALASRNDRSTRRTSQPRETLDERRERLRREYLEALERRRR